MHDNQDNQKDRILVDMLNVYLRLQKPEKAFDVLKKYEKLNSKKPVFLKILAQIYYKQKKLKKTLRCLKQIPSEEVEIYLWKGNIYTQLEKYELGIRNYRMAALLKENSKGYFYIGVTYIIQRKYKLAISALNAYLKENPDDLLASYLSAAVLLADQKEELTLQEFQLHLNTNKSYLWLKHLLISNFYTCHEKFSEAIEELKKASDNRNILYKDFKDLILYCKNNYTNFNSLAIAMILNESKEYYAASVKYKEALQILNYHPTALYQHVKNLQKLGKVEQSYNILKQLIKEMPDASFLIYEDMGKILLKYNKLEEAKKNFLRSYSRYPKNKEVLMKLGFLFAKQKKTSKAIKYYQEALKLIQNIPNNRVKIRIYNNLAWLYTIAGSPDYEKALLYAKKSFNLNNHDGSVADTLGWAYYHNKQYKKALEYLLYAKDLYPGQGTIKYHIAKVYMALNKPKLAEEYFKKALLFSPNIDKKGEIMGILRTLQDFK